MSRGLDPENQQPRFGPHGPAPGASTIFRVRGGAGPVLG